MENILLQFGVFGASILLGFYVYRGFAFFDGFFPTHVKTAMARRLRRESSSSWPQFCIQMNDIVFVGKNPGRYSRPKFWRTCCVSFGCAFLFFLLFFIASESYRVSLGSWSFFVDASFTDMLSFFLIGYLIINPILDYLSIFETRIILKWMDSVTNLRNIFLLSLLDVLLTLLLIQLFISILYLFLSSSYFGNELNFEQVKFSITLVWRGVFLIEGGAELATYIYTTFLTTFWTWLFVSAEAAIRLYGRFQRIFPIEARPFSSIGLVAAPISGIVIFIVIHIWNFLTT